MSELKEHLNNDLGHGLDLSISARSKELGLKIIMGALQLEIFGTITPFKEWTDGTDRVRSFTGRNSLSSTLKLVVESTT